MTLDADTALALLEWQREMGVDEAMLDDPVDRYAEPIRPPMAQANSVPAHSAAAMIPATGSGPAPVPDPLSPSVVDSAQVVMQAEAIAARASTLADLAELQGGFEGLDIRRGARSFVFADGNPAARVMIIGEAPGEEEDRQGRPFVGRSGQLLDLMFGAIGLSRQGVDAEHALYITNALPWRPPGNRRPEADEIDAMRPFLARHVELAAPDFLILMGNAACQAALRKEGILRLRGKWTTAFGRPALPMTHPSYLLRTPIAKREAWADLLSLAARLQAGSQP